MTGEKDPNFEVKKPNKKITHQKGMPLLYLQEFKSRI